MELSYLVNITLVYLACHREFTNGLSEITLNVKLMNINPLRHLSIDNDFMRAILSLHVYCAYKDPCIGFFIFDLEEMARLCIPGICCGVY